MENPAKVIYRKIKYSIFTTPELETVKYHKKRQGDVLRNYLASNSIKCLQIGAQNHPIHNWLNVDIRPRSTQVMYMDATKKFPIDDGVFDFVFSEHMIEHIGFNDGLFMLGECHRILKKGGKIRISTPDLKFLISLYQEPKSGAQEKYIQFSKRYMRDLKVPITDTIVINNFFRDWGHQFIYDAKTLMAALSSVGFMNITFPRVSESSSEHLRNLEKHGLEITDEFNVLESIVVEAEK